MKARFYSLKCWWRKAFPIWEKCDICSGIKEVGHECRPVWF